MNTALLDLKNTLRPARLEHQDVELSLKQSIEQGKAIVATLAFTTVRSIDTMAT